MSAVPAAAQPAVTFHEIRRLVHHLPKLEPVALPDLSPYGKLAEWVQWLARSQGGKPVLRRMRLAMYVGAHGCAESVEETRQRLAALTSGTDPVVKILTEADADLRAYELDLDSPTADFRSGPALSEEAAAHAMSYGMMAVVPSGADRFGGWRGVGLSRPARRVATLHRPARYARQIRRAGSLCHSGGHSGRPTGQSAGSA